MFEKHEIIQHIILIYIDLGNEKIIDYKLIIQNELFIQIDKLFMI